MFTLGRLPDDGDRRRFADEVAGRVGSLLAGRRMTYGEAGRALGVAERAAVELEAESLLLPGAMGRIAIAWQG